MCVKQGGDVGISGPLDTGPSTDQHEVASAPSDPLRLSVPQQSCEGQTFNAIKSGGAVVIKE